MTGLLTRYRPTKLSEVIGQKLVCKSLQAAIDKKTNHAFLFNGPSGTGKTTLARIVAQMVGSTHRTIQEIDAATFNGIDDMRMIISGLQYQPFGADSIKSIIVDECHMMSKQAWNSLLKSVEQPPKWVYWFFCTTEPNRVIETIKTRCLRLELKPVQDDLLFVLIAKVSAAEGFKLSDGVMELCAKEANGSPRQALANLALCCTAKDRPEAAQLLRTAGDSAEAFELARALLQRDPWIKVQGILSALKETDPESIRHVIQAYAVSVILGAKSEKAAGMAMEILDAFKGPFYSGDKIAPVALACGKVLFS